MATSVLRFLSILCSGLLAGAFLYAGLNVVATFYDVPVNVHLIFRVALMKHNSIVMPALTILSIILPLIYALIMKKEEKTSRRFLFIASTMAVAILVTTFFGNVPINGMIKTWVPEAPPHNWRDILREWNTYHVVRTITAIGGFICVLLSLRTSYTSKSEKSTL